MRTSQSVCVIGLGYIGLPTAVAFASRGIPTIGVDVNDATVASINRGEVPFVEPGIHNLLAKTVATGLFQAQSTPVEADTYIICVPTPLDSNYEMDSTYVDSAVDTLAPFLRPGVLVIIESTISPGTTAAVAARIARLRPDLSLDDGSQSVRIAHCPERVLPGRVLFELEHNDRIIGGYTPQAAVAAKELYAKLCRGDIVITDAKTAEMVKLAENSFRDVNIAFANELSLICERLGVNVWELIELANRHPRVDILQPGPGVGGHCIAVDPWFIVSAAPDLARLIRVGREVNDAKPNWVIEQVESVLSAGENPVIAALGIAFKNDIDDCRESPSLEIVQRLAELRPDADILVVEPNLSALPTSISNKKNVRKCDLDEALAAANLVLLLVHHREFIELDRKLLDGKAIVDTRGVWRQ